MSVPASLECRELIYFDETAHQVSSEGISYNISVLQYNILADAAVPNDDEGYNICGAYDFCPKSHRYMDSK